MISDFHSNYSKNMLDICQNKKFPCLCSYVPISETHQNMYNFPHSVEKIGRFHYSVLLGTPPHKKNYSREVIAAVFVGVDGFVVVVGLEVVVC